MQRFRFDSLARCNIGDNIELDRDEANHLFRILRARNGDQVELIDGHGCRGQAVVQNDRTLRLESMECICFPKRRIHLFIAPPRRQKMDQILKETAELGVYRIIPMICERSVAMPDADSANRQNDLLFEACKQSGNVFLPILLPPLKFADAVNLAKQDCDLAVFGSPYENNGPGDLPENVGFFVGPEGGFSENEDLMMRKADFRPMRIGPWILRVETAAVAGVARLWI